LAETAELEAQLQIVGWARRRLRCASQLADQRLVPLSFINVRLHLQSFAGFVITFNLMIGHELMMIRFGSGL
jgi:hypothetical protein